METTAHRPELIVVGYDGSEPSDAALDWACRYAEAVGVRLRAVTTWHFSATYGEGIVDPADELEQAAHAVSERAAHRIAQHAPALAFDAVVANGDAGAVLVETSTAASLLVVGSRGHGGLVSAMLGSVSMHCVHHADCPVVVVRGSKE